MKNIENTKIDYLNIGKFVGRTRSGQGLWECRCECGNEFIVDELYLNKKKFHSCSKCGYKKPWENKENVTSLRLYHTWNGIKQRCTNPNAHSYNNYGGRGIKICEEWLDFNNFRKWAEENGYNPDAPAQECTLDRIDSNGNYCPENCRFASRKEQDNNKRNCIWVTDGEGETHNLSQWAEILGIGRSTLYSRYLAGLRGNELLKKEDSRGKYCHKNYGERHYKKEAVELKQIDKRIFVVKYKENNEIKEEIICVETNGRNAAIAKINEMGIVVTSAVRNACRTPYKGVLVDWERSDDGWILKCKEKNGDRVFDIEIGKMSKSNMIKYCRDEWIVIPAEMMRRLRGKEKKE